MKTIMKPVLFMITLYCSLILSTSAFAQALHVGPGFPFANLQEAAAQSLPGDSIIIHEGTYAGGMHIANLKGTENAWISITAEEGDQVVFEGGNNMQFSDAEYVQISSLILQGQNGNGMNIDDAGSFDSPTHHIHISNCIFRDIAATGNNDLLKLSGLDDFIIESCQFINGAEGGSGIDMVGCHNGIIRNNTFTNMGSNSIQAKGGTQHIRIERNRFTNGGLRNINLGGSTGLQFFRPMDAPFEAADLQVYANIFIGGWAGLAYVGSTRVDVANNTFIMPENWIFRILQETVDPSRFVACGDNLFRNNIIYYGAVHRDVNIGGNTRPESFVINNNLWFKIDNPGFQGPDLPVAEMGSIIQEDPLFVDPQNEDFSIFPESPAVEMGEFISTLTVDYNGNAYNNPPSIGAVEGSFANSTVAAANDQLPIHIFPNPTSDHFFIEGIDAVIDYEFVFMLNANGQSIQSWKTSEIDSIHAFKLKGAHLPKGVYYIIASNPKQQSFLGKIILH